MKKGKLFTVLVALVLAAVGAFVAVTSVLSAQNQYVSSTLNVTYTANNVSATVEVKSRVGASGDFTGVGGGADTHTFNPADGNASSATLTTASATLGFASDGDTTFDAYVIYQFKFQNNYTTGQGCTLYVTMTDSFANYGSESNVIRMYQVTESATAPQVNITVTNNIASIGGDPNWSTDVPGSPTPIAITVQQTEHAKYFYMVVAIRDQTKPISGYSNNSISFALSSTNS